MLSSYYNLTKPGIVRGNLITATAGFLVASRNNFDVVLLLWTLAGIAFIIASGCVYNNIIDRRIDRKMERTKKRALAEGTISVKNAAIFGTMLGILGFLALNLKTNVLTVCVGLVGIVFYVIIYGYTKRRSVFGTEVGTISGATPILAGYTAASNQIDGLAILLFTLMVIWQLPHFYSIAIFRLKDYKNAKIPVLTVIKGITPAKRRIIIYIALYTLAALSGALLGLTSWIFSVALALVGVYWFQSSLRSYHILAEERWARKNFGLSLLTLLIFSVLVSVEMFLP